MVNTCNWEKNGQIENLETEANSWKAQTGNSKKNWVGNILSIYISAADASKLVSHTITSIALVL